MNGMLSPRRAVAILAYLLVAISIEVLALDYAHWSHIAQLAGAIATGLPAGLFAPETFGLREPRP
jgi:hypothetical protein